MRPNDDTRHDLSGRSIAILATDGFEQSELHEPLEALRKAGGAVKIVSPKDEGDTIRGWDNGEWGEEIRIDQRVQDANAGDYDALVIPGGVINPDRMRMDEKAVEFVRRFFEDGKPVAAICHGPWMIVEADAARGRRMTSYRSIRTDLRNAGAEWVDEEVVVDRGLVTSRSPKDLPAFCDKMVEEIAEGVHAGQHA